MKPLVTLYVARIGLGVVAAVISVLIDWARGAIGIWDLSYLFNGITVALAVYLISYYAFKVMFRDKIEKQSKILSMGIGIYFFTWLMTWVLIYSILFIMR